MNVARVGGEWLREEFASARHPDVARASGEGRPSGLWLARVTQRERLAFSALTCGYARWVGGGAVAGPRMAWLTQHRQPKIVWPGAGGLRAELAKGSISGSSRKVVTP